MDDSHHSERMQHCAKRFHAWASPRLAERYLGRIRALLAELDWDDLTPRLLKYAHFRLNRTRHYRSLLDATAHDYVQQTVYLILSGKRHYFHRRKDCRPMYDFMTSVLDSLTSGSHLKRSDHVQHLALEEKQKGERRTPGTCSEVELPAHAPNQDEVVLENQFAAFVKDLPKPVRDYALLRKTERFETAADYAGVLATSERDIRNRHRYLRRKLYKWNLLGQRG